MGVISHQLRQYATQATPTERSVMEEMITTSEAGQLLGVSNQTIRRLVHNGKIAAIRTEGDKFRVLRSSIEQYIKSRMVIPTPDAETQQ